MNDTRGILFLIETLEHHIVTGLLFNLDKFVLIAISLNHERVSFLANLALKSFPKE